MRDEEELRKIKERLKEREEEDRKAVEELLERERKEQENIKERLKEREEEDRKAVEELLERERKEQENIKKYLKEREEKEEAQRKLQEKKEERQIRILLKQQSERISARLQPIGSTGTDTHSGTLPVYYVIVGRGPAAIINHTTLRQTEFGKKRINGLPVMHIGFANPWTKYMQHGMGQPPHLLNLPGFENHPGNVLKDEGLDSREFARCVEEEYTRLETKYGITKVITTEAWVVWIQTKEREMLGDDTENELVKDGMTEGFIDRIVEKLGEEFKSKIADYRLLVMNPKPVEELKEDDIFFVYASYIDICTGPGRPNVFPPGAGDTQECKKARTAPWLSPETWKGSWGEHLKDRKVLNGVDAIRDEVPWGSGERVCVTAGGGVGLNAAERARNEGCKLDWFGRTTLMDTFANPRNDTILKHPTENRILNPGESKILKWEKDDQIIPCKKELRYGYGAVLQNTKMNDSQVEVTLKANGTPKIKDYFDKQVGFSGSDMWNCSSEYEKECECKPSKLYNRLVVPNGQASKALGHAYFFARHLGLTPLTAKDGRMIGLTTGDGKVRVLGAAAQTYDKYGVGERNNADTPGKKMWTFWDSLPVSAVPDGFIFSGINIAGANQYFDATRQNKNANTATQDEIAELLSGKYGVSDARRMAKVIIEKRKRNDNNGYGTTLQIIDALRSDEETKEISELALIAGLLDVAYTPSIGKDLLDED